MSKRKEVCFRVDSLIESAELVYVCYDMDVALDRDGDMYCISDVVDDLICDFPDTEFIVPDTDDRDRRHELISSCDMVLILDLFCKSKAVLSDILYAYDQGIRITHKKFL